MKINTTKITKLEMYDKLAVSQAEVASGQKLLPLEEVFAKYKKQYGKSYIKRLS